MRVLQKTTFSLFHEKRKVTQIGALVFLVLVAGLTFYLSTQNQNNRQQASGTQVNVLISDAQTHHINGAIWGANLVRVGDTMQQFNNRYTEDVIKSTNAKLFRFPGGCVGQVYDWRTGQHKSKEVTTGESIVKQGMTVDEGIAIAGSMSARILFNVNISRSTDAPDGCDNTPSFNSNVADVISFMDKYNDKVAMYELGNEPWFHWNATDYADRVISYAREMRKKYPEVIIIAPAFDPRAIIDRNVYPRPKSSEEDWRRETKRIVAEKCTVGMGQLQKQVDCIDMISTHPYGNAGTVGDSINPWEFSGVGAYYPVANYTTIYNTLKEYSKNVALTEWNMFCFKGQDGRGNIEASHTAENGIFVADNLLLMAEHKVKIGILHAVGQIENTTRCAMVNRKTQSEEAHLTTTGKAFAFTSLIGGGDLLKTTIAAPPMQSVPENPTCTGKFSEIACIQGGDYPKIAVYSAYHRNDKKLYTYVVNRSNEKFLLRPEFVLSKMQVVSTDAKVEYLKANEYTDTTFIEDSKEVSISDNFAIPPISITRISLDVNVDPVPTDTPIPTPTPSVFNSSTVTPTKKPTVTPTSRPTSTPTRAQTFGEKRITGVIFTDRNSNGVYNVGIDQIRREVRVSLTGAAVANTTTDGSGVYSFTITKAGIYKVGIAVPSDSRSVTVNPTTLTLNETSPSNNQVNFWLLSTSRR